MVYSHCADAGYTGSRLSHKLVILLAHTGHSLGRNNRLQLLARGIKRSKVESTYHTSRRSEVEETTLGTAESERLHFAGAGQVVARFRHEG